MLDEMNLPSRRSGNQVAEAKSEIDLMEELRLLYARRRKLAAYFTLFVFVGVCGSFIWRLSRPIRIQGSVILNFKGIGKGEYPDGRKFSIDDLRSPEIISEALMDAGVAKDRTEASKISVEVGVRPIIPKNIGTRWSKQDKEGAMREEYFPNEFNLDINWTDFPRGAGLKFFQALVKRYREHQKEEQRSAFLMGRAVTQSSFYTQLLQDPNYDYDDILHVLDVTAGSLSAFISGMRISAPDSSFQTELKDIQNETTLWNGTHRETLKALISVGGLVKNKYTAAIRLRYRLNDSNMLIRQKSGELEETYKLLAIVQKPQPFLIGQQEKDGPLGNDATPLERLVSSNYISPLVKKASDLQRELKLQETVRQRLEKDVEFAANARTVAPQNLPPDFLRAVTVASSELERIIASYNSIVDRYLSITTSDNINVKTAPTIRRDGPGLGRMLVVVLLISGLLAVLIVRLEVVFHALAVEIAPR